MKSKPSLERGTTQQRRNRRASAFGKAFTTEITEGFERAPIILLRDLRDLRGASFVSLCP
jgi:hypothetical protein